MKRFRLSTLMLLVVITALCVALLVQHDRAARREAELLRAQMNTQTLKITKAKSARPAVPRSPSLK
jgi:hypothetical protein